MKSKYFSDAPPGPGPVPDEERCDVTPPDTIIKLRCPHRAAWVLDHEELPEDDLPKACSYHLPFLLADLIEPGDGIDELTIMRSPHA